MTLRAFTVLALLTLAACQRASATRQDCEQILARIVEIELGELGYRDDALLQQKRRELTHQFDDQLQACVGRPLAADAMSCVRAAGSTEALSHRCLH